MGRGAVTPAALSAVPAIIHTHIHTQTHTHTVASVAMDAGIEGEEQVPYMVRWVVTMRAK